MSEQWVPQITVHVNGSELPNTDVPHLQSVTVELRRQAPASCEIQFNNHSGQYDGRQELGPGSTISVKVGYTGGQNTLIFTGEVIGTQVRVQDNGPRIFVVRAFDYLHRLTRGRKTKTFLDQKFSDIISAIARERGLTTEVEDTAFQREYVVQHNQTDLDFIRGIAGWLDFDLHIAHLEGEKKLRFKAPALAGSPDITAAYEKPILPDNEVHLRRFDARQSLARVVSEVVVRGWDPGQKQEIIGRAKAGQVYSPMGGQSSAAQSVASAWGETERQLVDYKVFSQQEADKIALTKLNEYARSFIRADVEVQGHAQIAPGKIVGVTRVGPRFDGNYLVDQVTHVFSSKVEKGGGYTTRFVGERAGW